MATISGAVYDPPSEGMPTLTVVFGADGNVIIARPMPGRQEAEALLAQIRQSIQNTIDEQTGGAG